VNISLQDLKIAVLNSGDPGGNAKPGGNRFRSFSHLFS
jgi:hypothetical protein